MINALSAGCVRGTIGGEAVSMLFSARHNLPARATDGKEGRMSATRYLASLVALAATAALLTGARSRAPTV